MLSFDAILLILLLIYGAWQLFLFLLGSAFAGGMEPTKSKPLLHAGIAVALVGPPVLALSFLAWEAAGSMGYVVLSRIAGVIFLVTLVGFMIAGITIGILKSRAAKREGDKPTTEQ
ncbi:hypothetical protein NA78x_002513 [Anatilimnocola sp. NA78]|uniref:hypothetical protein n=1 Tax=Anatilimnocola sp. NA78 TaxID=3415683 RepID=UPI003CE468DE